MGKSVQLTNNTMDPEEDNFEEVFDDYIEEFKSVGDRNDMFFDEHDLNFDYDLTG